MTKQRQTFPFNPPIKLVEEAKWLLGVTLFDCTNSVFNIADENNSFSIIIPGHYQTESGEKTTDQLNKILDLKSLDLHVQEVRKIGNQVKIGDKINKLSGFDTHKKEILKQFKNVKYNDLEDMVYRFQLTYDEIMDILDLKYIPTKIIGYSLNTNIYQISDINKTLQKLTW